MFSLLTYEISTDVLESIQLGFRDSTLGIEARHDRVNVKLIDNFVIRIL